VSPALGQGSAKIEFGSLCSFAPFRRVQNSQLYAERYEIGAKD
jgi:hypothetical protein